MTNWYNDLMNIKDDGNLIVAVAVDPQGKTFQGDYRNERPGDNFGFYELSDCKIKRGPLKDIGRLYIDFEFDSGYGGTRGPWFTAWGDEKVYFPICYDGSEWVGNAPRFASDVVMPHQGG